MPNPLNSEKEKMLAGKLYNADDPELTAARTNARRLTRLFNTSTEEMTDTRLKILSELLGQAGTGLWVEPPFYCDYGFNIFIGDNTYLNFNCVLLECNIIRIGKNVQIAPTVQIYTAYHPIIAAERIKGPELAAPVTIDDNVWLGGAIICPDVTIGQNSVIGAGSVVTNSIPANVVAAGNPCRIIRQLEGGNKNFDLEGESDSLGGRQRG